MARWFYVFCAGFIALMLVVGANGCNCSRQNVRKIVCNSGGPCTQNAVVNAQELCLLRCKRKRADPTEQQARQWPHLTGRTSEQIWNDAAEQQSGDSQGLLDNIYHKLEPVWQERVIKLLKQAAEGAHE